VLLAVGFPVALIFAWIMDLGSPSGADKAKSKAQTTRLDVFLAGALVLVLALVSYQQLTPAQAPATAQQPTGVEQARAAAASVTGSISIAVLPFANLSDDREQEFFSDGMTDEISGTLAKIPDLRVVGRTSAFQYKTRNTDLRSIGQALGATHLIEGSVRKAGNRVRITAQLVQAENGLQIWSENYDRDLTDIFVIQENIAQAIATSLRMPLGLRPGENLVSNRTGNAASYEAYLRAKALIRGRSLQSITEAVKLLEDVVARDPDFAPAWGFLATAYRLLPRFDPARLAGRIEEARVVVESAMPKAEAAARRAIQLDPENADGYEGLGDVERMRRNYLLSVDLYEKALALDGDNPELLNTYSITLAELGYLSRALPVREKLSALEPFVPLFHGNQAAMIWASGKADEAIAMYNRPPGGGRVQLAMVYASQGRYGEAADVLQTARVDDAAGARLRDAAVQLLRTAPSPATSPQTLPEFGVLGWVYLPIGVPDRVLNYHEGNFKIGYHGGMEIVFLWAPMFEPVRKTDRFKALMRSAGYVDYWRARGWPEFCRPTTADDFVCD
jgi:TolB-like protein